MTQHPVYLGTQQWTNDCAVIIIKQSPGRREEYLTAASQGKGSRAEDAVLRKSPQQMIMDVKVKWRTSPWTLSPARSLSHEVVWGTLLSSTLEPLLGNLNSALQVQTSEWKGAKKQCVAIVVSSLTVNQLLYSERHLWVPFTYIKKRKLNDHGTWSSMRPSKYVLGTSNSELRTWTESQDNTPILNIFAVGIVELILPCWNSWLFPYGASQNISALFLLGTPLHCEETNSWISLHF